MAVSRALHRDVQSAWLICVALVLGDAGDVDVCAQAGAVAKSKLRTAAPASFLIEDSFGFVLAALAGST